MQIGIPRESLTGETRVAATPKSVEALRKLGYDVVIESGAGERASFGDAAYETAGARVVNAEHAWNSDIVFKVNAPNNSEMSMLRENTVLVSLISPAIKPDLVRSLAERNIAVIATDAVPRISRAQALDVLSSMANIAGYRAVVEAAHEFGSFFTGQVTAAGKVPPAKVLIAGAGVAGLAAIGTAGSLGAIVRATDARPEVKEQVESMGAEFLSVRVAQQQVSSDGYAKETSDDYNTAAATLYAEQCKDVDIIITTALIPGKPAPRLITADMVASMKPGSVIVDMAASNGGNVEGTVAGEVTMTANGVKIIGYTDLAGRLPAQASQLYANNLVNMMKLMTPTKDGRLQFDMDDVVVRGMTVAKDGEVLWPPPPIHVSASPVTTPPTATPVATNTSINTAVVSSENNFGRIFIKAFFAALGLFAFIWLAWFGQAAMVGHLMVFTLACVVGYYVIGNVHHALHTPLMSVTNAISGIIVVGALTQVTADTLVVRVLALIALFFASINVFGGFTVTQRMLRMFRKGQ